MENENIKNKEYEAEQKLFETCPKMKDPDWWDWDAGDSSELPPDPEMDKIMDELAEEEGIETEKSE